MGDRRREDERPERASGPPAVEDGLRIALISPKGPLYRHRGGIFRRSLRYAPLTLPTLAALVPPGVAREVRLFDEGVEELPDDLDADVVGLTVITGTAPRAYALARRFRERGATVVLGGPHVTLLPEEARRHADAICTGYAEDTWPELLRDVRAGRLRPRYDQARDLSLAGRPAVRRDLLPARSYLTTDVFEATRACVHSCEFCVVPTAWGLRPFQRPVEEVAAEVRASGARRAIFIDLNLVADRAYAVRLFDALAPLAIEWYGLATVLLARDAELVERCARSGCRGLLVGLESIRPDNLRALRKGFARPEEYAEAIEVFHSHRIAVQGAFVFGGDGDTPDVFEETARFAVEAGVDLPRFAVLTPFPATPLFDRLASEGRILTRDWELYDGQHVVFRPARMEVAELQRGVQEAWRRAYSARSIWRRLRRSPAPLGVALLSNLGYRFYGRNLHRFYTCDWPLAAGGGARGDGRAAGAAEPAEPAEDVA